MKKSNILLGMCISFIFLAIISFFVKISAQIITTLSICSLLFTAAQTIQSFLTECDKENRQKFELFKDMGNIHIDKKWDYIYKKYLPLWIDDKKQKHMKSASNILEIIAFIILLPGLIVPLSCFEYEWVNDFCTFLSFSFLFLSIWLVEKVRNRAELWSEIQLMNMLLENNNEMEGKGDGQA